MMSANKESVYWQQNEDWYTNSEDGKSIVIKEDAPERAKKSFELWKQIKN